MTSCIWVYSQKQVKLSLIQFYDTIQVAILKARIENILVGQI